ncbi:CDP-paratose synthetase [Buttiauxella sp. JUb87]|uniref:NAD-dependent epimerase/dehydratase n=1 Tax=Buttiauxella sp. JUb87 TaxID=2485129 RepID=UPI00105CE1B9|nr:NAD-dependent epimerase/dehydratase [Buttiauxella sp. JUb87]TDN55102.1 CDP-paratose synthetase [Buttiauxella sp. JUb87]
MRILITGANGYLGSQLISHLSDKHITIGLVRKNTDANVFIETTDEHWIEKIVKFSPDVVINTVACYGRKNELFSTLLDSNIIFPAKILESLPQTNTLFINCGTSLPPEVSPYAFTKQKFPEIAKFIVEGNNNRFLELKLEHFFGALDSDSKFTSMIIRKCLRNETIQTTSGVQKRDFLYVEDLLSAFDCILSNIDYFPKFDSIEIGSGEAISIREYVETVHSITNSKSNIEFGVVPQRKNELMFSCANTSALKNLGWSRKYSLVGAISEIIDKERV